MVRKSHTRKQLLQTSTRGQCNSMWKGNTKIPLERRAGLFFLLKSWTLLFYFMKREAKWYFASLEWNFQSLKVIKLRRMSHPKVKQERLQSRNINAMQFWMFLTVLKWVTFTKIKIHYNAPLYRSMKGMLMNPPKVQISFWGRGTGWQAGIAHWAIPWRCHFGCYLRGSWGLCVSQGLNACLLLHPVAAHLLGAETFPFYVHNLLQTPECQSSQHGSLRNIHFSITFQ